MSEISLDTAKLYLSGNGYKEISAIRGISEKAASNRISRAREKGLIPKEKGRLERLIELLKIGITDNAELAKNLNTTCNYISNLKSIAYRKIREEEYNLGLSKVEEQRSITREDIFAIKFLMPHMYPKEIACKLGVPIREVYDVIYGLTSEEKIKIKRKAIKENTLYESIVGTSEKGEISIKDAVYKLEEAKLTPEKRLDLARIFYMAGDLFRVGKILHKMVYDKSLSIENRISAQRELDNMHFDTIAKKVRRDYITKGKNGELTNFDDLSNKYSVGRIFLTNVIGPEEEIDFSELTI